MTRTDATPATAAPASVTRAPASAPATAGASQPSTPAPQEPRTLATAEATGPEAVTAAPTGGATHPRILWESGTLRVEVAPNRGVDLEVETPDAVARVVGTGFTVLRDTHGTRVEVLHGTVHTLCHDGREARLGVGESLECLPTTSGGMLAHARALEAEGAPDDAVLAALEAGLRLEPDGGVIRPELAARRISVLARRGRANEAAAAAEAWLAGPDTLRREQVRTLALELAIQAGDCDRARALGAPGDALGACATNP